ncbi:MAG: DAK2 domain-containing protein [Dehalococcoidia bacterium]|nr:DAK2 domain-containing protein [Dehalococcoidia bacterium]
MTVLNATIPNMLMQAITNLEHARGTLNQINVFPVPDGDTGTNMYLTLNSCKELINSHTKTAASSISDIADNIFLNSKGNSGVILSSFLHGCLVSLEHTPTDSPSIWINCFQTGYAKAYASIGEPREGTMLSVMKGISNFSNYDHPDTMKLNTFWEQVTQAAWNETEKTADGLPELQAAEVIDSGAAGLTIVLYSFAASYNEDSQNIMMSDFMPWLENYVGRFNQPSLNNYLKLHQTETWGQCCQMLITKESASTKEQIGEAMGMFPGTSSLVISETDSVCKIHFHSSEPEPIFSRLQDSFEVLNYSQENMDDQVNNHFASNITIVTDDIPSAEIFKHGGFETVPINSVSGSHADQTILGDYSDLDRRLFLSTSRTTAAWLQQLHETMGLSVITADSLPSALTASTFFDETLTVDANQTELNAIIEEMNILVLDGNDTIPSSPKELFQYLTNEIKHSAAPKQALVTIYLSKDLHQLLESSSEIDLGRTFPDLEIQIFHQPLPKGVSYITVE